MQSLSSSSWNHVFNCLQGNCYCLARTSVPPFVSTIALAYEVIIENGKGRGNMIFIAEKLILYYFQLLTVELIAVPTVTWLFIILNKSFLYCAFCADKKRNRTAKSEPTDISFCCLVLFFPSRELTCNDVCFP